MRPERFSNLPDYPFARLRALYAGHSAGDTPLSMSIGEPTHAFPTWVSDLISEHVAGFNVYPPNDGTPELRENIAAWVKRRYAVGLDPEQNIIALNGTREGLYNAAMGLCPETKNGKQPLILTPNPFYQVYMFAALSVRAKSVFVPATHETGFLPNYEGLSEDILNQTALAYICSPSNPQGSGATRDYWRSLIQLAEQHDFRFWQMNVTVFIALRRQRVLLRW